MTRFFVHQGWHARFTGENLNKNKILYDRVEAMAEKHGCSTAQLALAWVLHQGNDVVPIPGKFDSGKTVKKLSKVNKYFELATSTHLLIDRSIWAVFYCK